MSMAKLRFVFCFYLILPGDPLSQRLLFRGPMESLQVHTHSYTRHNYKQSQTIKSYYLYAHTVWSVTGIFFQVIQGCRAEFEPRTSHNSCSASSLKLPLSHPCTPFSTCVCVHSMYAHMQLYVHSKYGSVSNCLCVPPIYVLG